MYYERILKPLKRSFFLFGCRGTGKSTWIKKNFPNAEYIALLSEEIYQKYLANSGLFAGKMRTLKN